jgi:hypothetical protein
MVFNTLGFIRVLIIKTLSKIKALGLLITLKQRFFTNMKNPWEVFELLIIIFKGFRVPEEPFG